MLGALGCVARIIVWFLEFWLIVAFVVWLVLIVCWFGFDCGRVVVCLGFPCLSLGGCLIVFWTLLYCVRLLLVGG